MWKKDEPQETVSRPTQPPMPSQPQRSEAPARPSAVDGRATIGRSITIRGDVTGDEELVIQGRVEGTVDLKQHNVTVGPEGKVKADISGCVVTVEGEVEGDLRAQERVVLRSSARVEGDVVAPRVVLEDGATFRGSIDMSPPDRAARPSSAGTAPVAADKPAAPGHGERATKP
jgi:cytoskeletal protein CcmA (bactofilin family)